MGPFRGKQPGKDGRGMAGIAYAREDFKIIDADQHVTEPADLWSRRVPRSLADRAPQAIKLPNGGDGWAFQGGKVVRPLIAPTNSGGLAPHQVTPDLVITYDSIRPSHFDPQARV